MTNRVILTGRLTRDIELRYTRSSTPTASFSLAVDRGLTKEKKEEAQRNNQATADFPRVVVFGKQAENAARYLAKGSMCLIEGRIQTGSYTDKDGKTVYTTDVLADRVEFLDSKSQGSPRPNNQEADDFFDDDFTEVEDDGVIPF